MPSKKEIEEAETDYYMMFGVLPPVSPDDDYYSEERLKKIKESLFSGVKI